VPDGSIERRKEPLVRGRKDDEVTARPKVRCSSIQFFAVVIDMLQYVNVDDRIELPPSQRFL
jgi:hypothetical protein